MRKIKETWQKGWEGRAILFAVLFVALMIPLGIYSELHYAQAWERLGAINWK